MDRKCSELGDPPGEGVDGAANVLCTGERLKGGSRFVKMADFGGEHRWVRSSWLVRSARFDFSGPPPAAPGGRRLRVAAGLPACGGPSLLQEALSILPDTELHIVHMLQGLHGGAMLRLSGESSTFLADLSHDMHYLPFFPLLLITLHRATRETRGTCGASRRASRPSPRCPPGRGPERRIRLRARVGLRQALGETRGHGVPHSELRPTPHQRACPVHARQFLR
ncbi:unnamed protein product [Prorocentrum cordatum]|uniref:Uncharacterized protein n=1 Tax=Prorocentrum cordatum TaxID=2364126 RepID=A0ABN9X9W9_9DINO|nr:unnamed protein product [Polarella glacialis]